MINPRVAIIILNWNGKDYLKDCLPSVLNQDYGNFAAMLIDNGSSDGSVEFVKNSYSEVEIIALDKNYEFAKANNIAIKKALEEGAQFIALLNNDTKVEKNWLSELVKVMESNPKIGICASKMLKMDNSKILDSTGHVFIDGIIRDRGSGELDKGQYDTKLGVVGGCAGAVLYRKEMLDEIGLFDEQFGFNYEDAELSWRAYKYGWKARYVPQAIVYHLRSGSVKDNSQLQEELRYRGMLNLIRTIKRHANIKQKIWVTLIWIKEASRQRIYLLFKGKEIRGGDYLERLKLLWLKKL